MSARDPIAIRTIDLDRAITRIEDVTAFRRTRIFVSQGGDLIGSVDVENAFAPISARITTGKTVQISSSLV